MKQSLLLSFLLYISSFSYGQTCLPEGITFNSQEDINNFALDYPDCSEIEGLVWINGFSEEITDLSPLLGLNKIHGDFKILYLTSTTDLSPLFNLDYIGGDFEISFSSATDFTFGELDSVGGSLLIHDNPNVSNIDGFNKLIRVNERYEIWNNPELKTLGNHDALQHIGLDFKSYNNQSLEAFDGFDNLTAVDRHISIHSNPNLSTFDACGQLKTVGGSLQFNANDKIETLNAFNAVETVGAILGFVANQQLYEVRGFDALKYVGSGLDFQDNPNLIYQNGFGQLDTIVKNLNYIDNNSLLEINGIENLKFVGGSVLFLRNADLQFIRGFDNLNHIEITLGFTDNPQLASITTFTNLRSIEQSLSFYDNPLLENIEGLASLSSLGGKLVVSNNDAMIDLDELSNITRIGDYLLIEENDNLISIDGLKDIDPYSISGTFTYNLRIQNNEKLSNCAIKSVCRFLYLPGKTFDIKLNGPGCNSPEELGCFDKGFSGHVFFDRDEDGIKDNDEYGILNQKIELLPNDLILTTDFDGVFYYFIEDSNSYDITFVDDPDWTLTSGANQYFGIPDENEELNKNLNFGLKPLFSRDEGDITVSSGHTLCNRDVEFVIRYRNSGTSVLHGFVHFDFDIRCIYKSSNFEPDNHDLNNNILTWNIRDLQPYQYRDLKVILEMPDEMAFTQTVDFYGILDLVNDDAIMVNDTFEYKQPVRCSFDPNDKLSYPLGTGEEDLIPPNSQLRYTVRFQNTGNAPAQDVYIVDTISQLLDMETFQIEGSSFPARTIIDDRIVYFYFDDINLPDSLSNEPESHGYVTFKIDPVPNLPDPTTIYNTGYIYFDLNQPIQTNTTESTLGTPTSKTILIDHFLDWQLTPNPVSDVLQIKFNSIQDHNIALIIYDVSGATVWQKESHVMEENLTINVDWLRPGIYLIKAQNEGEISTKKFIKN